MARPIKRFGDFIGQGPIVRTLEPLSERCLVRKLPLPHLALVGRAGTGKTELVRALAAHYGNAQPGDPITNLHSLVAGRGLLGKLHGLLRELKFGDILFLDEAHALPVADAEILYPAIDGHETFALTDNGQLDRGRLEPIAPFALILATNRPGKLAKALKSRVTALELQAYSPRELKAIAEQVARGLQIELTPQAARVIAARSDGTPRGIEAALRIIARMHDGRVNQGEVEKVLDSNLGRDANGLTPHARELLALLAQSGGAARHEHLAHALGLDSSHVRTELEMSLLKKGYITVDGTSARRITDAGRLVIEPRVGDLTPDEDQGEDHEVG